MNQVLYMLVNFYIIICWPLSSRSLLHLMKHPKAQAEEWNVASTQPCKSTFEKQFYFAA